MSFFHPKKYKLKNTESSIVFKIPIGIPRHNNFTEDNLNTFRDNLEARTDVITPTSATSYQYKFQKTFLTFEELKQIKRTYFNSPIVVEKYKLVFFWNEKSGCSTWKHILQYLSGINVTHPEMTVHNPKKNGLKYLCDYSDKEVSFMILNNSWTKAAFVREPRERILSTYFNKVLHANTLWQLCRERSKSFNVFLHVIKTCNDEHWESQVRAPRWLYQQMLIGTMSDFTHFTESLLKKIGAWTTDIRTKLANFRYSPHATNASKRLLHFYNDTKLQDIIFDLYKDDYEVFGFDKKYFQK